MATTFLEPGGDATFNVAVSTQQGFWATVVSGSTATDFVNGGHIKSLNYPANTTVILVTQDGTVADAGTRISFYFYMVALPNATTSFFTVGQASSNNTVVRIRSTAAGVIQLFENTNQIGTDGPTLSTGVWYRISLAYTITSTIVNRFELFLDGVSAISITNATITNTGSLAVKFGSVANLTFNYRSSDHYIDNSSSLTDTGNIWVTAKRPFANGTLNEWTTQIGSGGSGYGSGHSPQINERPLSTTNGWSITNAAKKTEEYSIESLSVGDFNLTGMTIVDFMGWASVKVGSASTGNIILVGNATNISVTTAYKVFTKVAGSSTYPAGNTDIGVDTNTVNQLFSLAECGILVAFIPNPVITTMACSPAIFTYTPQVEGNYRVVSMPCSPAVFTFTGLLINIQSSFQNSVTRLTQFLALRKTKK